MNSQEIIDPVCEKFGKKGSDPMRIVIHIDGIQTYKQTP